jgi:hypothetical protein
VDGSTMVNQVLSAYRTCGPLGFAYGQGSTFTGFETDADLDIVLIWPADIPPAADRPAHQLCDPGVAPVQFDESAFGLDNLVVNRRDVQVAHYRRSTFDSWAEQVNNGEGWHGPAWPLPLHAVAGFVYGVPLADPHGDAAAIRERISTPSATLRSAIRESVAGELPEYRKTLTSSARRSENWLFHQLGSTLIKRAYAAWFTAEGFYLPFPKHLDRWIERFDLDRELARREQLIWRTSDLLERRLAITDFVEGILALPGIRNH